MARSLAITMKNIMTSIDVVQCQVEIERVWFFARRERRTAVSTPFATRARDPFRTLELQCRVV